MLSNDKKRKLLKALSPQDIPEIVAQELTEKVAEAINSIPTPKDGLRGPVGPKGDKGDSIVGPRGEPGKDGKSIVGPKGDPGKDGKDAEVDVKKLQRDILSRIPYGGGNANRNILVGNNPSTLSRYTDLNFRAGQNVVLTYLNNDNLKTTDVTIGLSGGGTEINRSISTVNVSSTIGEVASTDYVIVAGAGIQLTLPTASGNTNLYTVKNKSVSSILVNTTGGQTIDGDPSITLATQYTSVDIISDDANWLIT